MCSVVNRQSDRFSFFLWIRIVGTLSLAPLRNPSTLPMMEPKVCCSTHMELYVTERRFPPPWTVEEPGSVLCGARRNWSGAELRLL
jgi:hypothetical protein